MFSLKRWSTPVVRTILFGTVAPVFVVITPLHVSHADVNIHCLDIGQGDATLVVSSSGQAMLIDGGDNGLGTTVIVPYLASLGITELDYMIATHYHADHIGGLDEVYHQVGVNQQVYDRGWTYPSSTFTQYASVVSPRRATLTTGLLIDLGEGVTVTCLGLNGNGLLSPPYNVEDYENEYCLALLVECGDFDFLVAGDLIGINSGGHRDIESSIAPAAGQIEVYQVNHHSSFTSSNIYFLATTQPEVAIVSVGDGNPFGHPHQEVLTRLANLGAFVYQTETGAGGSLPPSDMRVVGNHIVITTDGYGEYYVDGDQYVMDEPDPATDVPGSLQFALRGNYPNPFNPTTSIVFTTATAGPIHLSVFDLAGRNVYQQRFVVVGGEQTIQWHGTNNIGQGLPSGIYTYRIATPDGVGHGRMTLVK